MAELLRYRPQPVVLPEEGTLSREFFDKRQHLPGRAPLEAADYAGFETHTLFNDVFIHHDGSAVCAVGPPWVNLAASLLPMRLSVWTPESEQPLPLKHQQSHQDRVTLHRFALPRSLRDATSLMVQCQFANGLKYQLTVQRQVLPVVQLQFVTLQKNNPEQWIVDWVRYGHQRGVGRFVLYDNGSDNLEAVSAALAGLSLDVQLILVDWPFGYGPVRSYYNQFCQASQNNHAHQCFGSAQWTGHFDVDEYLVGPVTESLPDMLSRAGARTGLFRFDSHWVPRIDLQGGEGMPTVRDFPIREIATRGKAHKYIARNSALVMANTHNARVRLGYWRKAVAPEQGVFLHFKALTTRWRSYATRGEGEAFDERSHCRDERVIQALAGNPPISGDGGSL